MNALVHEWAAQGARPLGWSAPVHRVFIGYDHREARAYDVAERSLRRRASGAVDVRPLLLDRVTEQGLLSKRFERRDGKLWDTVSQAFCSTEFAISRFLVPILAHTGWVLFVDCDVVFLADVAELFALADDRFAAMVVKHPRQPVQALKMDGQAQADYPRKNWSSVVLWNADHPANRRLSLPMINGLPGRGLHRFGWLNDDEIGELPPTWNWLVGVQPKPAAPQLAHFTLGGPFLHGWQGAEHDEIWNDEAGRA